MTLTAERIGPSLCALAAAVTAFSLEVRLPAGETFFAGLLSASISASAILVGFIATAKSILMALPPDGIRKNLNESGYIDDLASYLSHAMIGNLAFCVLNMAGFFDVAKDMMRWYAPLWFGVGIFAMLAFWRVGRIMMAILRLR